MLEAFRSFARRKSAQVRRTFLQLRLGERWAEPAGSGLVRRSYPDYETYLRHQRTKLDVLRPARIRGHDATFYAELEHRIAGLPLSFAGASVLCLGARQGTEVRFFIDRGAFAVGIDLNPGHGNRYVVVGDFHDLQYHDGTIDIVYTNSLDHVFDLDRVIAEVRRVLRPGGRFLVEVIRDERGFYESFHWETPDRLVEEILGAGFVVEQRTDHGRIQQFLLRTEGSAPAVTS